MKQFLIGVGVGLVVGAAAVWILFVVVLPMTT